MREKHYSNRHHYDDDYESLYKRYQARSEFSKKLDKDLQEVAASQEIIKHKKWLIIFSIIVVCIILGAAIGLLFCSKDVVPPKMKYFFWGTCSLIGVPIIPSMYLSLFKAKVPPIKIENPFKIDE